MPVTNLWQTERFGDFSLRGRLELLASPVASNLELLTSGFELLISTFYDACLRGPGLCLESTWHAVQPDARARRSQRERQLGGHHSGRRSARRHLPRVYGRDAD